MLPSSITSRDRKWFSAFGKFNLKVFKRYCSSLRSFDPDQYTRASNIRIVELANQKNRALNVRIHKSDTFPNPTKFLRNKNKESQVIVLDDVVDEYSSKKLCNVFCSSEFESFMVTPGERKLSGDTTHLENIYDESIRWTIDALKERTRRLVEANYVPNSSLREAGSIISWLCPPMKSNTFNSKQALRNESLDTSAIAPKEGMYSYWSAHCDKANNNDYDITALLYLSSDFQGGDLVFMDDEVDTIIHPKRGRLVIFNSCIHNIHRVTPVLNGNRFLLSVWYRKTCKK